ncbi:AraC family transcriptional regulator [Nocardia heshunensis]
MIVGTVPARTAAAVRDAALRIGVSRAQLDGVPGLGPEAFGDELIRVPTASVWQMWEMLDAVGPGAGLAVTAAERGTFGVWDYLFSSAPTLAEVLAAAVEFRAVLSNPADCGAVIVDGGLLTLRESGPCDDSVLPAIEEFTLALLLRRAREATGHPLIPVRVAFRMRAPGRHAYLIDEFGTARIDFGAPHTELTLIDAAALPTAWDPHQAALFRHYAELLLRSARVAPDWRAELHSAIARSLPSSDADLRGVAERLAISPRTLQRRLAERGTSWRAEVETVRQERARTLLHDTALTVESISNRLGYSDNRSFRRAFQRWHGRTPTEFRRERPA